MIVAFLNQKGGVGKTTLALHLAGQWAREGRRVTVIDADPQGSALDWSAQRAREGLPRLFGVIGLARDTLHHEAPELALGVDHVVIDGPPRVAALLRSALLAADLVLIPAQPSPFDGWASAEMPRLLEEARLFRPGLLARFVLNRCAARTVIAREARLALMGHEPAALVARIGQRVAFADAARTGRLVCDLRPHGIAAREIAALTAEIGGMVPCLLTGDSALLMPWHGPYDMILVDPPYGDTSLAWDRRVADWPGKALAALKPSGSLWVFGSLRSFFASSAAFRNAGWKYAQELVWEKQNGSSFHADRFRRVHELIVQFYHDDAPWSDVYNDVPTTPDSRLRRVRQRPGQRAPHMGSIGTAIHPTEKPTALLEILIRTSCPPGGLVGDWFAGSGAAGVACRLAGRRYVGCEIDLVQKARDRIASVLLLGDGIAP